MEFSKNLFGYYWSIIKKFRIYFISVFLLGIMLEVIMLVTPPFVSKWTFAVFENAISYDVSQIIGLLLMILGLYFIDEIILTILSIIQGKGRPYIKAYTNINVYKHIYNNDTAFFIDKSAGQISNMVGQVSNNLFSLTIEFWTSVIGIVIGFLVISGMLFKMDIFIAIIVVGNGLVRMVWYIYRQKSLNKNGKKMIDLDAEVSGARTDSLGNVIITKLFANIDYENSYVWKKQEKLIDVHQKHSYLDRMQGIPANFVWDICRVFVLFLCWGLIRNGAMSISSAAFAATSFVIINSAFMRLNRTIADYSENKAKAKHAFNDIIQIQNIIDLPDAKPIKIKDARIQFDDISFDYGDSDIIKNFKLLIEPNEKIGIVGLSGAGKTTLVNLVLRLYDVKSGAIKIDNQDIRNVTQDSFRRAIAFVPQDSDLFNRTLLENIRYANPKASKKKVIDAAKKANIHEFINSLPDKYETLVGNRGIRLSGGQRQRIALARAILKESKILVLDEATSSLDSESEVLIQGALQEIMKGKTTIAIAHRLSTLRNMDRIIVMENGKIKESGTHQELVSKEKGVYKKLWDLQTGGFIN